MDDAINFSGVAHPAEFQAEFKQHGIFIQVDFKGFAVRQMVYDRMGMGKIMLLGDEFDC